MILFIGLAHHGSGDAFREELLEQTSHLGSDLSGEPLAPPLIAVLMRRSGCRCGSWRFNIDSHPPATRSTTLRIKAGDQSALEALGGW